ncbi:MAG: amino acid ABC transporter substrate-binding protein [Azonexaceae bacterium]|nr:amino acid ABC transporter substrate-binding protein [Azonexaceae bacterium]
MSRSALVFLLCCALSAGLGSGVLAADDAALRVLVLENAPPMSFRDEFGQLTGFSVEIARAVCHEMRVNCAFDVVTQSAMLPTISQGKADIAAAGLLETPERRVKVLFAKPYYRSISLWLAPSGVTPGQAGVKVAVVGGSAQDAYGRKQGWDMHPVATHGDLGAPLLSGEAQAVLVPMISALSLQKNEAFRQLGLATTVLQAPELSGDASFGISPFRPELQKEINAALDRIKRNGTYDRINSRFLPFRVS